jgi:large subunit ribosomal protein L36
MTQTSLRAFVLPSMHWPPGLPVLRLTRQAGAPIQRGSKRGPAMRVRNSLRAAKVRDKNCRVVRRRGRVYVINKKNPRMKARQG